LGTVILLSAPHLLNIKTALPSSALVLNAALPMEILIARFFVVAEIYEDRGIHSLVAGLEHGGGLHQDKTDSVFLATHLHSLLMN